MTEWLQRGIKLLPEQILCQINEILTQEIQDNTPLIQQQFEDMSIYAADDVASVLLQKKNRLSLLSFAI